MPAHFNQAVTLWCTFGLCMMDFWVSSLYHLFTICYKSSSRRRRKITSGKCKTTMGTTLSMWGLLHRTLSVLLRSKVAETCDSELSYCLFLIVRKTSTSVWYEQIESVILPAGTTMKAGDGPAQARPDNLPNTTCAHMTGAHTYKIKPHSYTYSISSSPSAPPPTCSVRTLHK